MLHQAMSVPGPIAQIVLDAGGSMPASEGAYRFGWWLHEAGDPVQNANFAASVCRQSLDWLERVVLGALIPGDEERQRLAIATKGAVLPEDWDRDSGRRWYLQPVQRMAPKPRLTMAA